MKNLTLVKKDNLCCYYKVDRNLILKEYVNGDGRALRMLNIISKNLVWRFIRNNIVETHQPRILALNNIPEEEKPAYLGKLLMVRRVDKLPFDCILSGEDVEFSNGRLLNFRQVVTLTKEWAQENERYNKIVPAHFVFALRENVLTASNVLSAYFSSRNLELTFFRINLGVEIDEESGKVIPFWIGEGINHQNADIREEGRIIPENPFYLAEKILPKIVYEKQIGESS